MSHAGGATIPVTIVRDTALMSAPPFDTNSPSPAARTYYGWRIVALAALAMVGTLPGRTQGLGLITEHLLADLHLDRVTYAGLNFWATLIGALGALGVGRLMDRFGARVVLTIVASTLGATVCAMSQVTTLAGLAIATTLTRAIGQSALSVVSIAMVGHWFARRINAAMAIYSVALSAGFMVAFPVVGSLVQAWGWRPTWQIIGIALVTVLAPLAWMVARRQPGIDRRSNGRRYDGSGILEASPRSRAHRLRRRGSSRHGSLLGLRQRHSAVRPGRVWHRIVQ